jgi:2'-5' RNA ligase
MTWFTGIVPPENIYKTVLDIQSQFGDNRLEPHITITPPETVTDEANWLEAIQGVCKRFSPILISLPSTGQFGKRVLFVDVRSEGLTSLQMELEDAIRQYQKQKRNDPGQQYHPHLTLGRKWCGFTPDAFRLMKMLTEEYLSKDPVQFTAASLRVYNKPKPGGRYQLYQDVLFNHP